MYRYIKSSWYSGLDDSSEYAQNYKQRAMDVDPDFAEQIVWCLEDYIKHSRRGFISREDVDMYAKILGIYNMEPGEELSKVWEDVQAVAHYYAFCQDDFEKSEKLLDAASAFAEVVNEVARKYRREHGEM